MIITRPKSLEELLARLAPYRRLAVIGCGLCATSCQTGGKKEVAAMAVALSSRGKEVIWTEIIDGVCLKLLSGKAIAAQPQAEAVLVMACGSGVQTVAGLTPVPVHAALDSLYLGSVVRAGRFDEKCSLCGACVLNDFAGLCPITLCPKGLLNGPCGGVEEGRCETDPERECVWIRIYEAMAAAGRLGDLSRIQPPRSRRRGPKA